MRLPQVAAAFLLIFDFLYNTNLAYCHEKRPIKG